MGHRFPEFCALRAACRVSVRASSSATGDRRVASYQAAINSVAGRHYADWPFMVEVLNKWLEMNQDFVRDPLGYIAPDSSPAPASTTITTVQSIPSEIVTSAALPPHHTITQSPSTDDNVVSPSSSDAEAPEYTAEPSPFASITGTEPNDLVNPPSPLNDGREVLAPTQKIVPLSWIGAFRFPTPFGKLGAGNLTSRNPFGSSWSWLVNPKSPTKQMSSSPKASWFGFSFLANSYKGWCDVLKKSFAFRSG